MSPEEDRTPDAVDSEPKHYQRAIPALWDSECAYLEKHSSKTEWTLFVCFQLPLFLHFQVPQLHAIRGLKLCTLLVQSNTDHISRLHGTMCSHFFHDVFTSTSTSIRQDDKFQHKERNVTVLSHLCSAQTQVYIQACKLGEPQKWDKYIYRLIPLSEDTIPPPPPPLKLPAVPYHKCK